MSREGVKLLDDVTFTARAGEILGIAGIAGSGQRELLEAIAGLQSVSDGEILYHNPKNGKTENLRDKTPMQIRELGVRLSFVPEDRLGMGLVGNMDIVDNMMLRSYRRGKTAFLERKKPKTLADTIIHDLEVVTPSAATPVRRLSGGNVQKVLVGREIAVDVGHPGARLQTHQLPADVLAEGEVLRVSLHAHLADQRHDGLDHLRLTLRRGVLLDLEDQLRMGVLLPLAEEFAQRRDGLSVLDGIGHDVAVVASLDMDAAVVEGLEPRAVEDDQRVVGREVDVEFHAVDTQFLGVAQARDGVLGRSLFGMIAPVCDHLGLGRGSDDEECGGQC